MKFYFSTIYKSEDSNLHSFNQGRVPEIIYKDNLKITSINKYILYNLA